MPWKSEKQRRWAYANKPEMAKQWDEKYGSKPKSYKDGGLVYSNEGTLTGRTIGGRPVTRGQRTELGWDDIKGSIRSAADLVPIIGDALAAKDVYDELQKDPVDWEEVGFLGGIALLGVLPIPTSAAKAIRKGAGRKPKDYVDVETGETVSGAQLTAAQKKKLQRGGEVTLEDGRVIRDPSKAPHENKLIGRPAEIRDFTFTAPDGTTKNIELTLDEMADVIMQANPRATSEEFVRQFYNPTPESIKRHLREGTPIQTDFGVVTRQGVEPREFVSAGQKGKRVSLGRWKGILERYGVPVDDLSDDVLEAFRTDARKAKNAAVAEYKEIFKADGGKLLRNGKLPKYFWEDPKYQQIAHKKRRELVQERFGVDIGEQTPAMKADIEYQAKLDFDNALREELGVPQDLTSLPDEERFKYERILEENGFTVGINGFIQPLANGGMVRNMADGGFVC